MPGLNGVGLASGEGQLYSELLGQKLQELGLKVISARDIGAALGIERQREMLGCAESSCVAELAGALGADGMVLGDVGKLDTTYAVNLKVLSRDGHTLAIFNATAATAAELPGLMAAGARALARQLGDTLHRSELTVAATGAGSSGSMSTVRKAAIAPLAIGVAALIAFGIFEGLASAKLDEISSAPTLLQAAAARDAGKTFEMFGTAMAVVGGVGIAAAIVMFIAGGNSGHSASVALLPNGGAAFTFSGALP
ncbi:MAG: hypothetical protein IPJ65_12505 [Archangiaceae bacterium]|nr:hypothetical protein [Archangiaceae bacterium]